MLFLVGMQKTYSSNQSQLESIWSEIYVPIIGIRDLMFEIKTNDIDQLLNKKIVSNEKQTTKLTYYWNKDKKDLIVTSDKDLNGEIKLSIKNIFLKKLDYIIGSNIEDYFEGYDYKGIEKTWYKWEDPTGLKDITEISIKKNIDSIDIIEKKSIGTIRTKIYLKNFDWTNKKVISEIEYKIYEGVQSVEIHNSIEYSKTNEFWLPLKLNVKTKQKLNKNESDNYLREFEENYSFENYKINEKKALEWFTKN